MQLCRFLSMSTKKKKPFTEPLVSLDIPSTVPYLDCHTHFEMTFSELAKQFNTNAYTPSTFDLFQEEMKLNRWATCKGMINVNCHPNAFAFGFEVQKKVEGVYGAFGVHPHDAKEYSDEVEKSMIEYAADPKTVALGEMGLDYHYMHSPKDVQIEIFKRQLRLAVNLKKPIVIHTREAEDDTKVCMEECIPKEWNVHVHCFTGTSDFAEWAIANYPNLCIGFTGCMSFPSAEELRKVVSIVPLDRILLETDAPFMAPVPYRGRVCHSGLIPLTASHIAKVKNVSTEDVLVQTTRNGIKLYNLPIVI